MQLKQDLKYTLLVNLNNGKNEYKPELTFTIPKRYVTKESKMTKWFDKIMNQIGNRLQVKNGQWQEKYELVEITKNKRVTDVNSFINILINHAIGTTVMISKSHFQFKFCDCFFVFCFI